MRQLLSAALVALFLAGLFATVAAQHRVQHTYSSLPSSSFGGASLGSGLYEEPLSF